MRLIDADALVDTLGISDEDIDFKETLRDAPTIDAVPVVRCKECKHYRLCNEDTHLIACGYEWCVWWQRPVISTGYCHRGARMDWWKAR